MKIAITGASGFLGQHVQRALTQLGHTPTPIGVALTQPDTWRAAVKQGAERIIHLAFPGISDRGRNADPMLAFVAATNAAAVTALRGSAVHVVLASSAAVIGPSDARVTEDAPCHPKNGYGLAKLAQERGLSSPDAFPLTIARIFNLLGPGQPQGLMATDLLRRLVALRDDEQPHAMQAAIPTGPLHARRDYVDVREVAQRLCQLPVGCFNLCRGEPVAGLSIAQELCRLLGLSPDRLRPATDGGGVPFSCGDPSKITALGLQMARPWQEALAAMVAERQ